MKGLILICTVVFVFVLGYFIMKKVDMFLAENSLQTKEHDSVSSLRIAFETPDIATQTAELLESFSKKAPNCEIMLFYGSAEKIEKGLKNRELDFGFITEPCCGLLEGDFRSLFAAAKQGAVFSDSAGLSVFPLDKSEKKLKAVWIADEEDDKKKMFAELLQRFFQKTKLCSVHADVKK